MQPNRWLKPVAKKEGGYVFERTPSRVVRLKWQQRFGCQIGFGLVLALLLASLMMQSAGAQVSQATITEILDGNQVYIQNRQAGVNSVAQRRQQVRTGSSRAELRFNTGAIARLAQNSRLTVGDCARLHRGTVLVNGAINGCTQSTVAGVRGTIYTLDVNGTGQETIRVFEGEVIVSSALDDEVEEISLAKQLPTLSLPRAIDNLPMPSGEDADETPTVNQPAANQHDATVSAGDMINLAEDPITLAAGQQLTLARGAREALLSALSAEDFEALTSGELLREFSQDIPGLADLRRSFETLFPRTPFPEIPRFNRFPSALF